MIRGGGFEWGGRECNRDRRSFSTEQLSRFMGEFRGSLHLVKLCTHALVTYTIPNPTRPLVGPLTLVTSRPVRRWIRPRRGRICCISCRQRGETQCSAR